MKRNFELWLDESGDFDNDSRKIRKGLNPSLIGGVLVEEGAFGKTAIDGIIPEEFSHGTSEDKDRTFDKFKSIEKKAQEIRQNDKVFNYVVFPNSECIMVLDNNLTYLNIMTEGIVKLITKLKADFVSVHLNILIANRVDTTVENGTIDIVKSEEYVRRLKEKIIMAGLQYQIKEDEWNIQLGSARNNKKLMIADNICNCFLTRKTKFKEEQSEKICSVYEDHDRTYEFPVLQGIFEKHFNELMMESRMGEAITVICQSNDKGSINRCMDTVKEQLKLMNGAELELQYQFIKVLINCYLNITHDYPQCEIMIKNMLQYFLPILEEEKYQQIIRKMSYDLHFYLLTLYTHTGAVGQAKVLEEKCEKAFELLPTDWDMVTLGIKYDIRKVIELINAFDFENALELNKRTIEKCEEIKELLLLYRDDVKYDELGKAYGTQVQIYTFLLRFYHEYYEEAVEISDKAIDEFTRKDDRIRQYIYRVHLEIEAEKYDEAYKFLCMANEVDVSASANEFRKSLINDKQLYICYAYVELMAEGKAGGWKRADELYDLFNKTNLINGLLDKNLPIHPREIILWKHANYLINSKQDRAGFKAYDNAVDVCFGKDETINMIGLAIMLEKYAMMLERDMKESTEYIKKLKKRFDKCLENQMADGGICNVFGNINFEETDWKYYYDLSRKVTY